MLHSTNYESSLRAALSFFHSTDYRVPLPYLTTSPSYMPCIHHIHLMGPHVLPLSYPFCIQPKGLCCPCTLNVYIVGLYCPINFSTSLLLLQVVLRSSSPSYIFFSVCLSFLFSCHATLAIWVCWHIKKLADASQDASQYDNEPSYCVVGKLFLCTIFL